jgi:hypothetical protein
MVRLSTHFLFLKTDGRTRARAHAHTHTKHYRHNLNHKQQTMSPVHQIISRFSGQRNICSRKRSPHYDLSLCLRYMYKEQSTDEFQCFRMSENVNDFGQTRWRTKSSVGKNMFLAEYRSSIAPPSHYNRQAGYKYVSYMTTFAFMYDSFVFCVPHIYASQSSILLEYFPPT